MLDKKFNLPWIDPSKIVLDPCTATFTLDDDEYKKRKLEEQANEEWIWIEGYKATDKDMKCRNYQYELNKQHDMPEDKLITECSSGFHLCKYLDDVFNYYSIGDGHRFFKVSALVRKTDYEEYRDRSDTNTTSPSLYFASMFSPKKDKLVSKSIIFLNELSADEIFDAYIKKHRSDEYIKDWTEEDKKDALVNGIVKVRDRLRVKELIELGYSEPLSEVIMERGQYAVAVAAASQSDLSMDMRIAYILCNDD